MHSLMDTIDPAAVARALRLTALAGPVFHLPVTGSTNELALEAAQAGSTRGIWVADEQTAGRGRGGHAWHSSPGQGLYLSVLVTPDLPLDKALWLSLATGLAAQRAVQQAGNVRMDLRWPNDLLVGTRKLGGILVESAVENSIPGGTQALRYAVIGIGMNVHHPDFPPELTGMATSLRIAGAAQVSRQQLLVATLRALDAELHALEREHAGMLDGTSLLGRFAQASSWVSGKRVRVPEEGGYTGVTAGLDSRGFLLVDAYDGTRRTVRSGGVREL